MHDHDLTAVTAHPFNVTGSAHLRSPSLPPSSRRLLTCPIPADLMERLQRVHRRLVRARAAALTAMDLHRQTLVEFENLRDQYTAYQLHGHPRAAIPPRLSQRSTDTLSTLPPESTLELLHEFERLIDRIVQVAVWHLALRLNRHDPNFDQASEAIQAIGRILELRVQVRELIMQASTHRPGPDATSSEPEAEDLSELALQRETDHADAEDVQVSREVPPPLDTGE